MDQFIFNAGAFSAAFVDKMDKYENIRFNGLNHASGEAGVTVNKLCAAYYPDLAASELSATDLVNICNWLGKNPADYIQQVADSKARSVRAPGPRW